MVCKVALFGKLLVMAIFLLAGTNKFIEPDKSKVLTEQSLKNFDKFLIENGIEGGLPMKKEMLENSLYLVYFVGGTETLGALLILGKAFLWGIWLMLMGLCVL